ncbi:unnamed protein product, partial [Brachionus calyciflorus]
QPAANSNSLNFNLRIYSSQELLNDNESFENQINYNNIITKAFNIEISRSDLNNVVTGEKFNDSILNFYLKLVCNSNQASKCISIDSLITHKVLNSSLRGLPKSLEKYNNQSFFSIFCPLFLNGNHWAIIIFDVLNKKIHYYDSIFGPDNSVISKLCSILGKYITVLNGSELWNISYNGYPKQHGNDKDCGVFVCTYAKYYAFNRPFDFNQEQITEIRKSLANEIISFEIDKKFTNNY